MASRNDVPESEHHEESETYQDSAGRWQNYYGGAAGSPNASGPGMGLRIPLEPSVSYATSGEADKAAQARSDMYPSILEGSTELKEIASGITGSVGIAKSVLDKVPPGPTNEEVRAAHQKAEEARAENRKRQMSYEESVRPQIEDYKLSAQQYAADAKAKLPQQQAVSAAPKRGLQPFLAATKDEQPETTISKFVQAVSLFATMAGGGRSGARASLSAMTGALEGWSAGNRYKADREYQTWKDSTEAMFRSFDDEMRVYNSLMVAERVPLEQKFRALELSAWEHKNAMLAGEMSAADYEKAAGALEKRQDARIDLEKWFTKVVGAKEQGDAAHELARQKQEENFSATMERLRQGAEKIRLAERFGGQRLDLQRTKAGAGGATAGDGPDPDTLERLADERMAGAPWTELIRGWGPRAQAVQQAIDRRVTEKMQAGGDQNTARVVRQRMLQADTRAANQITASQADWSQFEKAFTPAVENMIRIAKGVDGRTGMPVMDKWLLKARMEYGGDEQVKALDQALDVVAMEYARVVKRRGVTDVALQNAAKAKFNLGATPEQFRRVVDETLLPDIEFARQGFEATKQGLIKSMRDNQRALTAPVAAAPTAEAKAPEAKTPGKSTTLTVNGKQVTVTEE